MGTTFGGRPVLDPKSLIRNCVDRGLPFDHFAGEANRMTCPVGRGPGRGAILLRYDHYMSLDRSKPAALIFDDGKNNPAIFQKIEITKATCILPGADGDPANPFLCELADKRIHLFRTLINQGYNVRSTSDGTYITSTLNGASPYTWQELFNELWGKVGTSSLGGSAPTLPFTPHGTPEGWEFYGMTAWDALNNFVERMACVLVYNPFTDAMTIVRAGIDSDPIDNALNAFLSAKLQWDTYHLDTPRIIWPEKLRVLFRTVPAAAEGTTVWTVEDVAVTAPAPGGAEPGSMIEIYDDLYATTTNAADRHSRALERADDWTRVHTWFTPNRVQMVHAIKTEAATLPGYTVGGWSMRDNSGGAQTEIGGGYELSLTLPIDRAKAGPPGQSAFLNNVHVVRDVDSRGVPTGPAYFEKVEIVGNVWPPVVSSPRVTYGKAGDGYTVFESENRQFRMVDNVGGPVTHIEPAYLAGPGSAYIVYWITNTFIDLDLPDMNTASWTVECIAGELRITPKAVTKRILLDVEPPGDAWTGLRLRLTDPPPEFLFHGMVVYPNRVPKLPTLNLGDGVKASTLSNTGGVPPTPPAPPTTPFGSTVSYTLRAPEVPTRKTAGDWTKVATFIRPPVTFGFTATVYPNRIPPPPRNPIGDWTKVATWEPPSPPPPALWVLQQSDKKSVNGTSGGTTLAFPSNVTAGRLLIATVTQFIGAAPVGGIGVPSDTVSSPFASVIGTETRFNSGVANTQRMDLFYAVAPSSGANTVTFTWPSNSAFTTVTVQEWSGNDPSVPFRIAVAAVDNSNTNTAVLVTVPGLFDGDMLLVLAATGSGANPATYTEGSKFTNVQKETDGSANQTMAVEWKPITVDGDYDGDYTIDSGRWGVIGAGFRSPASPPIVPPPPPPAAPPDTPLPPPGVPDFIPLAYFQLGTTGGAAAPGLDVDDTVSPVVVYCHDGVGSGWPIKGYELPDESTWNASQLVLLTAVSSVARIDDNGGDADIFPMDICVTTHAPDGSTITKQILTCNQKFYDTVGSAQKQIWGSAGYHTTISCLRQMFPGFGKRYGQSPLMGGGGVRSGNIGATASGPSFALGDGTTKLGISGGQLDWTPGARQKRDAVYWPVNHIDQWFAMDPANNGSTGVEDGRWAGDTIFGGSVLHPTYGWLCPVVQGYEELSYAAPPGESQIECSARDVAHISPTMYVIDETTYDLIGFVKFPLPIGVREVRGIAIDASGRIYCHINRVNGAGVNVTLVVYDVIDRADATDSMEDNFGDGLQVGLHVADTGERSKWYGYYSQVNMDIVGRVYFTGTSQAAGALVYYTWHPSSADYSAAIVVDNQTSVGEIGVMVRAVPNFWAADSVWTWNFYRVKWSQTAGGYVLEKYREKTVTQLGSTYIMSAPADDDEIRLFVSGSGPVVLTVKLNGATLFSANDTSNILGAAGTAGYYSDGNHSSSTGLGIKKFTASI